MSPIGRDEILRLIPHSGEMCLLDEIIAWDADKLTCRSNCFGLSGNPMRREDGSLGMACGIEIAGQAMAAHGTLSRQDGAPRPGMLVGLRDVRCAGGPLQAGELIIEVNRIMGDNAGAVYGFLIVESGGVLLSGRATVVFQVPA